MEKHILERFTAKDERSIPHPVIELIKILLYAYRIKNTVGYKYHPDIEYLCNNFSLTSNPWVGKKGSATFHIYEWRHYYYWSTKVLREGIEYENEDTIRFFYNEFPEMCNNIEQFNYSIKNIVYSIKIQKVSFWKKLIPQKILTIFEKMKKVLSLQRLFFLE